VIDAQDALRIYRVICNLFSDNEAALSVASLIFLIMVALFSLKPVPGNPAKITSLNHQNGRISKEQMSVLHGAYVKK
jgi:hypothetical protein